MKKLRVFLACLTFAFGSGCAVPQPGPAESIEEAYRTRDAGGSPTDDPFSPELCGGAPMTVQTAVRRFEPGGLTATLGRFSVATRERRCVELTGCGPWTTQSATPPRLQSCAGPMEEGDLVLAVSGRAIELVAKASVGTVTAWGTIRGHADITCTLGVANSCRASGRMFPPNYPWPMGRECEYPRLKLTSEDIEPPYARDAIQGMTVAINEDCARLRFQARYCTLDGSSCREMEGVLYARYGATP